MDFTAVLEQRQRDRVDGCIAPALVEEPTRPIEMREVVLVGLGAPELHVGDFKIAPEVTGAVAVRFVVVVGPELAVDEPVQRVLLVQVLRVAGEEFDGLGPEGGDGVGGVEDVDVEAVGLVVVLHVVEDVVVDVAEEADFGLDAPVVAVG